MSFSDVWQATLFRVGGEPITVSSVVVAAVLLAAGYVISRMVSRGVSRGLLRRVHLEPGAANAIESLSFYALFVAFAFTSLNVISFPLTIFTIAGGAVAIGIGFGSQNVMNNFISGLILLFERPIRAGDLVGVEGTHRVVEHIGGRSTRIRTGDNTHMIVPNSTLLENSLVNFTLSDDVVRTVVPVGVAYGSDVRLVERILSRILRESPAVLQDRDPRVLFTDFGDNALGFEAVFWIRARTTLERRQIESDLRFRIDELFREAGVVIAFPQRDVHLDTLRPLDVRVVSDRPADAP
ncbi:MAG: mechanosensitive ion channel family protein [Vicinamibacterales bacterium]